MVLEGTKSIKYEPTALADSSKLAFTINGAKHHLRCRHQKEMHRGTKSIEAVPELSCQHHSQIPHLMGLIYVGSRLWQTISFALRPESTGGLSPEPLSLWAYPQWEKKPKEFLFVSGFLLSVLTELYILSISIYIIDSNSIFVYLCLFFWICCNTLFFPFFRCQNSKSWKSCRARSRGASQPRSAPIRRIPQARTLLKSCCYFKSYRVLPQVWWNFNQFHVFSCLHSNLKFLRLWHFKNTNATILSKGVFLDSNSHEIRLGWNLHGIHQLFIVFWIVSNDFKLSSSELRYLHSFLTSWNPCGSLLVVKVQNAILARLMFI